MSECFGSVTIGPTAHETGRPIHLGVLGQLLRESDGGDSWVFSSIPVADQDMVATFRLRASGVSSGDVVRVGTSLALYAEPEIGDIGGAILEHLGSEETYDVLVTPELATLARPIVEWSLTARVTGDEAMSPITADLAQGYWRASFAQVGRFMSGESLLSAVATEAG